MTYASIEDIKDEMADHQNCCSVLIEIIELLLKERVDFRQVYKEESTKL